MLLCCLAAPALAQDVNSQPTKDMNFTGAPLVALGPLPVLRISNGWIAAAAKRGDTMGYVTIANSGADDQLVGASCSQAQGTVIKEYKPTKHKMAGMLPMDSKNGPILMEIDVPANGQAELKPDGPHLLLQDVLHPLTPGQQITCRFDFRTGGPMDVRMRVAKADPQPAP